MKQQFSPGVLVKMLLREQSVVEVTNIASWGTSGYPIWRIEAYTEVPLWVITADEGLLPILPSNSNNFLLRPINGIK